MDQRLTLGNLVWLRQCWCGLRQAASGVKFSTPVVFFCACTALGIRAGEHSSFDSSLWTRPLRYRLMQRWSFSHVDYYAGGARFRKRTGILLTHYGTPSCRSLPPSLDYHISFGETAHFAADCLRHGVMNITVSRLSSLVSPCLDSGSTIANM